MHTDRGGRVQHRRLAGRRVHPLEDVPREVEDAVKDPVALGAVGGDDEGDERRLAVAGGVGGGEGLVVGEEGAQQPAHGAQAAELLAREAQQDLVHGVQWHEGAEWERLKAPARVRSAAHRPDARLRGLHDYSLTPQNQSMLELV